MKLFCSAKLQEKLGCTLEKAPAPGDPLDHWHAILIDLYGYNLIAAILPDFRFCVILRDTPVGPSTDLSQLLVPAIREALRDPYYGIPQSVVDAYMPEDTQFALCAPEDQKVIHGLGATTREVQVFSERWFLCIEGMGALEAQRAVNRGSPDRAHGSGRVFTRWEAVKEQLLQRYGRAVPAMELEISLDLQQYVMRRTLVVSEDITFDVLHDYLKVALQWKDHVLHQFILPPARDRQAPLHIFGYLGNVDGLPKGDLYLWGEDVRLSEQLQAGDRFRYVYYSGHSITPWEVDIQVCRRFPSAENLPICTLCEGKSPPEWLATVADFQPFYKAVQDPGDPRHWEYACRAGAKWLLPDLPEEITPELHLVEHMQQGGK